MFHWKAKNKGNHPLFPLQEGGQFEVVDADRGDDFFDEALADYPDSAKQPNRSFVGTVISRKRFYVAAASVIGILLIFIAKTSALQIWNGQEYRLLAESNRIRERVLPAQRGIIYDRDGEILAKNEPTFHVVTAKSLLPSKENQREEVLRTFAERFHLSLDKIYQRIDEVESDDEAVVLVDELSYDVAIAFALQTEDFPGLDLELGSRRSYITDEVPSLSHLLGYTGVVNVEEFEEFQDQGYRRFDHIGKQGLERSYEALLHGTFGQEILEVDALGNTERIVSKTDPINGENLHLTVDLDLHSYIEYVLEQRMEGTDTSRASIVVMEPESGALLALVSWPAFDANVFTSGIDEESYNELLNDEDLPLFPRAYAGDYPSGSTIKPIYAASALMEGIIDDHTTFLSTGGIRIGPWFFPDWRASGHGKTDVYHAIADSVNTFFYMIGGGNESFTGLGIEKLMEYTALFGFGSPSGLDVPGEAKGFLPSKEWKRQAKGEIWYIGDTYHVAIGQGDFLTTPLQIARATAVFANGGNLVTPHLAQNAGLQSDKIVPDDTVSIVREGMRRTVSYGSARSLRSLPVSAAGKTGTAQWSTTRPHHSWFTGFAPFEEPEVVITVLIEEGGDDYLAVPVAKDILNWWFAQGD